MQSSRSPSKRANSSSSQSAVRGMGQTDAQQRGPVDKNPNAVQGKGSQLDAQRKANGLDKPMDMAEDSEGKGPQGNASPAEFVGISGMVFTQGGTLNLRDSGSTDAKVLANLPLGAPLECTGAKGKWLKVTAWPGGKATKGWVHSGYVKVQPGLDKPDKAGDTDDRERYIYKEMEGQAFQGEPSVDDVKQGSLGDCYLITAMGAIAATAGGKAHLKKMVTPHGKSKTYKVKFKKKVDGKVTTVTKTVDAWFPTQNGDLRYALKKTGTFNKPLKDLAMWPAIVEKAYAAWQGSYDDIEGGHAEEAIADMTGLSSKETPLSDIPKDEDLLAAIKGAVDRGEAVTASANYNTPKKHTGTFKGSSPGPYKATGDGSKVNEKTVKIIDRNEAAPSVRDDGKGNLKSRDVDDKLGGATGTVDYKAGKFDVTYPKGYAPASDSDLQVEYKAHGQISKNPIVYGRHAYVVRGFNGDKIVLFNPWNSAAHDPAPMDIATFRKLFRKFTNSVMPDGTVK